MITEEIMNSLVPQERGISDLGENGTFESIDLSCSWIERDNDQLEYGIPTVINCQFISADVNDPSIIKSVNSTEVKLSGEYGLSTFDQLSYEFKDIETNETFKKSGWPPTDPRVKYMYKLNQDPRETRDVNYVVDFVVEFDMSELEEPLETIIANTNPLSYTLYVDGDFAYRKDRVIFNQTVRNYTFRKLAIELKNFLEG